MAKYKYITSSGSEAYTEAATPEAAIASAPNRMATSGVQRYTEPTPVVTPTPTPIPPVTTTTKTKDTVLNGDLADTYNRYFSPEAMASEREAIESENSAMRQGLIDAINVQYSGKVKKTEQLGEEELARQRSMNLRSGVVDSPIGDTEVNKTKKNTADEIAMIEAEKAQAVSNALFKFDELKTKKLEAATAAKRQAGQDLLTFRSLELEQNKETKKEAKEILASMGKAGVDFEKFKLDDAYQTAKDAGLSDLEMLSTINENSPTPTNLTTKIVGDQVITSYYDPITKKTVVTSDALGFTPNDPDNQQIITAGGNVFMYDKGTKKMTTLFEGTGEDSNPTGTDLKIAYDNAAAGTVQVLEDQNLFGADGYIAPETYREYKNQWIKAGMPGSDFDARMMSYINPSMATKYPVDKGTLSKFGSTPTFNLVTE